MNRVESGRLGETIAAAYLELSGYEILRRNVRIGHREIDLVARRDRTLAFVEVKLRSRRSAGGATAAVNWAKQREILLATAPFAGRLRRAGWRLRYDVIAIQLDRSRRSLTVRHFLAPFAPPSAFTT